jgi:hypothetical protein
MIPEACVLVSVGEYQLLLVILEAETSVRLCHF